MGAGEDKMDLLRELVKLIKSNTKISSSSDYSDIIEELMNSAITITEMTSCYLLRVTNNGQVTCEQEIHSRIIEGCNWMSEIASKTINSKQINYAQAEVGAVNTNSYVTIPVTQIKNGYLLIQVVGRICRPLGGQHFTLLNMLADQVRSTLKKNELETNLRKSKENQLKSKIASQVAHDIRSPLAALNMATAEFDLLPEHSRIMLRGAINRIQDIANNLLEQNKSNDEIQEKLDVYLLSPIIEAIVSEKRTQLRSKMNVEIVSNLSDAYGLFSCIEQSHFKRILSNLINNATEAFDSRIGGVIEIGLLKRENNLEIIVKDNGKGIPENIIEKLGFEGASFGKESCENSGSGLGLSHTKNYIYKWGGNFHIESQLGLGTSVILGLPIADTPKWLVSQLSVYKNQKVIVIDDDSTIHQIWDKRFLENDLLSKGVELLHFTNPHDITTWVINNGQENTTFLCDYEFIGHQSTGIDLIEKLKISRNTILVTSRYEESSIKHRCETLKIKLIPKSMAEFVPLTFCEESPIEYPKVDLATIVHIDDDELMRMAWTYKASSSGKKLLSLASPLELEKHLPNLDPSASFYIDSCLGEGLPKGEDVAKVLYEKGFKNLFLSTGYDKEDLPNFPWIKEVIGKEPPVFL
jgi:signal transduction histidine kinase